MAALVAGQFVKDPNNDAVFKVNPDGTLSYVTAAEWAAAGNPTPISRTDLVGRAITGTAPQTWTDYATANPGKLSPGTLVKSADNAAVYVVNQDGTLRWITPDQFNAYQQAGAELQVRSDIQPSNIVGNLPPGITRPTPSTPVVPTPPAAPTPDPAAAARLKTLLDSYGLGDLTDWANNELIAHPNDTDTILLDLRGTQQYQQKFGNINTARQKLGLEQLSPTDIMAWETQFYRTAAAYGLPPGFATEAKAQELLGNGWNIQDAEQRIVQGYAEVANADPTVRQHFTDWFGGGAQGTDAMLAAHFLDSNLTNTEMQRQITESQIGGMGQMSGVNIDEPTAQRLYNVGVTGSQAKSGFMKLADLAPLFQNTIDETGNLTAAGAGVNAMFGLDATSQAALDQRLRERQAAFSGGGGAIVSSAGAIGLGTAQEE